MRYVDNKRKRPDPAAVMIKAKQLRAEYLSGLAADARESLHRAAVKGFNALTRLIGPETAVEQRRRRKARAQHPFVLGNVQGVSMSIPQHGLKQRHA